MNTQLSNKQRAAMVSDLANNDHAYLPEEDNMDITERYDLIMAWSDDMIVEAYIALAGRWSVGAGA